jgi:hypothetical protein
MLRTRLSAAAPAALKHFALTLAVAIACATLVFWVWFPHPFREISGGRDLFWLLVVVDVVVGPLLTLVVFDAQKRRFELWCDLGAVVLVQVSALAYGLHTVMLARPAVLAFEGDQFRAVSVAELDWTAVPEKSDPLHTLSLVGPRVIGARVAQPADSDYLRNLSQSIEGVHPSMRPDRWVAYDTQRKTVTSKARALAPLRAKQPDRAAAIDKAVRAAGLPESKLGYLPLRSRTHTDWIVIVNMEDGEPKAFAPVDGW